MRKVLYAASTFGHLAAFHRPYLRFFQEQGYEVTALAGGTLRDLPEADRIWEVPFEKKITSPDNFRIAGEIARRLRQEHYDIISVHTALAAFFVRLAVRWAGKGETLVLNTVHGYLFDEATPLARRTLLLAAERLTAGVTDGVLTMNRADEALARRYRLGGQVVAIPGMGMDYPRFSALPHRPDPERFTMVYAAEFSGRKSQPTLLRAMTRLPDDIHLRLLGTGETLEECRALADRLGVTRRVHFEGYVADVPAVYAAADLCVAPSRIEGLPFHVMEAMAAGLPVVASRVKGHEDLIGERENGLLYPYGDEAECARCIEALYRDSALRAEMGARNRRTAEQYGLSRVYPMVTAALGQFFPCVSQPGIV